MIDTIVLRIHRVKEKYSHLVKYLEQINPKSYAKKFHHEGLENISKTSILYGDTGHVLDLTHRSSINIASSHYSISFFINETRDFIELNFSIPKYLYTTNVMQFIDQHNTSSRHCYDKLINLLSEFFNKYFPWTPDWEDVEVNRIDICFNQFFLSKGDALRYLQEQKDLSIKYAKTETNVPGNYSTPGDGLTTVMYTTQNYSFKIYHKGTEFRKNDFKELVKNNPMGFNLMELAENADKVLRYEMTCRKGLLNYLFKEKLRDNENTVFNHNFTKIKNLKGSRRNNMMRDLGRVPVYTGSKQKAEIFIHKTIHNKTFDFTIYSPWEDLQATSLELFECFNLPFNFELFEQLELFFWRKVKDYQLGVKMGIKEIHDKIKEHQKDEEIKNILYGKKDKVSQTGQLLLIATLSQYTDIADLKHVLPKATYYRYVKKMENLGIPKHSPDIAVNPPPLDYQTYFYYFGNYHTTFN